MSSRFTRVNSCTCCSLSSKHATCDPNWSAAECADAVSQLQHPGGESAAVGEESDVLRYANMAYSSSTRCQTHVKLGQGTFNGPFETSTRLQTLWGSRVKLGRSRLPASAWLSCSTSYMLYDGFPISTFMPPLVMGCLWTRFPLRSRDSWSTWLLSFTHDIPGFFRQITDPSSGRCRRRPLYSAPRRLFAYLCLRLQT